MTSKNNHSMYQLYPPRLALPHVTTCICGLSKLQQRFKTAANRAQLQKNCWFLTYLKCGISCASIIHIHPVIAVLKVKVREGQSDDLGRGDGDLVQAVQIVRVVVWVVRAGEGPGVSS